MSVRAVTLDDSSVRVSVVLGLGEYSVNCELGPWWHDKCHVLLQKQQAGSFLCRSKASVLIFYYP